MYVYDANVYTKNASKVKPLIPRDHSILNSQEGFNILGDESLPWRARFYL